MSYRVWIVIAGLAGMTAVLAGALGFHIIRTPLHDSFGVTLIYDTAQLYHALHSLALLGVAVLLAVTEGRRRRFAAWLLQLAAWAFLGGMLLFSGGIYLQVARGFHSDIPIVPTGGLLFVLGWLALMLAALGLGAAPLSTTGHSSDSADGG